MLEIIVIITSLTYLTCKFFGGESIDYNCSSCNDCGCEGCATISYFK